jgi:hypothetical protein
MAIEELEKTADGDEDGKEMIRVWFFIRFIVVVL